MEQDFYIQLIYQSFKDDLSADEKKQLERWLLEVPENKVLQSKLQQEWELSKQYQPDIDIDTKGDFDLLRQRIHQSAKQPQTKAKIRPLSRIRNRLSIAASILVLIALSWWLWPKPIDNVAMIAATTEANEKREVILADGTQVWLNSNSSLRFPEIFENGERRVTLAGEAFFSVTKNPDAPFIITVSDEVAVEVLGTSFNIAAQNEGKITVQVASGRVEMRAISTRKSIVLSPEEAAQWQVDNQLLERIATHKNAYAWQKKSLIFDETPLSDAIVDIATYFHVSITLDNLQLENCVVSGWFPDPELTDILNTLKDLFALDWTQENQHYRLYNGNCQ